MPTMERQYIPTSLRTDDVHIQAIELPVTRLARRSLLRNIHSKRAVGSPGGIAWSIAKNGFYGGVGGGALGFFIGALEEAHQIGIHLATISPIIHSGVNLGEWLWFPIALAGAAYGLVKGIIAK